MMLLMHYKGKWETGSNEIVVSKSQDMILRSTFALYAGVHFSKLLVIRICLKDWVKDVDPIKRRKNPLKYDLASGLSLSIGFDIEIDSSKPNEFSLPVYTKLLIPRQVALRFSYLGLLQIADL